MLCGVGQEFLVCDFDVIAVFFGLAFEILGENLPDSSFFIADPSLVTRDWMTLPCHHYDCSCAQQNWAIWLMTGVAPSGALHLALLSPTTSFPIWRLTRIGQ